MVLLPGCTIGMVPQVNFMSHHDVVMYCPASRCTFSDVLLGERLEKVVREPPWANVPDGALIEILWI